MLEQVERGVDLLELEDVLRFDQRLGAQPLVEKAARILLDAKPGVENVAAESVTVADVAALARAEDPPGGAAFTVASPFTYEHRLADYLRR